MSWCFRQIRGVPSRSNERIIVQSSASHLSEISNCFQSPLTLLSPLSTILGGKVVYLNALGLLHLSDIDFGHDRHRVASRT